MWQVDRARQHYKQMCKGALQFPTEQTMLADLWCWCRLCFGCLQALICTFGQQMVALGLICSVRRQHLALFEGHCDSSLNRQFRRHHLLIHCADCVHCEAVVNSYFIVTSLDRVCAIDCSALTLSFVLLLRLYACLWGLKWGRCFLYIAVWISTSGYQLLTILTQYCSCSIHCSSVTLPCGMWHLVPYYFSAISVSHSVIPLYQLWLAAQSITWSMVNCSLLTHSVSFTYLHSVVHKLSKHIASTRCFVSGQPAVFSWSLSPKNPGSSSSSWLLHTASEEGLFVHSWPFESVTCLWSASCIQFFLVTTL